jgi:transcription elongation GreA/GreB family factor
MYESDLASKLSQESPTGAALMNKKKGENHYPGGTLRTIVTTE